MNRQKFARNIATSLTLGRWSKDDIQSCLERRLPLRLHSYVPLIAADLFHRSRSRYAPSAATVAQHLEQNTGFERVFRHCQKHGVWPGVDLSSPIMAPLPPFDRLDLPDLPTLADLSDWLFFSLERLDYFADLNHRFENHGETAINHYHYISQKKKTAGIRVIEAPKQNLKSIQRRILTKIIDPLPTHPNAFGFVKGRNCLQAAQHHLGEDVVIGFDLKDFFPSIGVGRVFGLFRSLGYPHQVARYLSALCTTATPPRILERLPVADRATYRAPHLPQGSPVSPALANHVCFALDRRLSGLAQRVGAKYSRYADDLTFSGDRCCVGSILKLVPQIVQGEGFTLNPVKTRVMPKTSRQTVTGIVVNQHLNIDRTSFDQLKAIIHACGKLGDDRLSDPTFRASLEGQIAWVETVNPNRGARLWRLLAVAERHVASD